MGDSDEQLLDRMRAGDQAAFENLFLRYYQRVYRVLYGLVGAREQAEDLAQETFLTLLHHPPVAEPQPALLGWLCRVALNRGYNALRGERRERARLERLADPPASYDPHAELLRSEDRARVQATLARLPDRQGKLLLLRSLGHSYAEIAEVINVAPSSIGTLLARAERAFLHEYMQIEAADISDER